MRSLELNWVRNEDKSLVLPELVFAPIGKEGGIYYVPTAGELIVEGRFVDNSHGTIVVNSEQPERHASVLAHEWRHHWQIHRGWSLDPITWDRARTYDDMAADYFLKSRCEFDALRFSLRKALDEVDDYWRGVLAGKGVDILGGR